MKTITILRHAKTNMYSSDGTDHCRELHEKGLEDRHLIATAMNNSGITPELILCSTASRARQTISAIANEDLKSSGKLVYEANLYLASPDTICNQIANVDDSVNHIMVCAHNPGLTDFVNEYTDLTVMNLPTCGLVSAEFDIDSWSEVFSAKGIMKYHLWPKLFR